MGLFKRLKAPQAKIELKLDEVAYVATDKLTGRIVVEPQEEVDVKELRLEFGGSRKIKWKSGWSSSSTSSSLETKKIAIGGPVKLQKGQHYDQSFQVEIPFYSKSDPFTEIDLNVKGVAALEGRPDLTHEVKPAINFPFVIECLRQYGGCGFVTQPLAEPIKVCPNCGRSLEKIWDSRYRDESKREQRGQRF